MATVHRTAPARALSPSSAPDAAAAVHRALDLLGRASSDWRNPHAEVAGPLHWAVAIAHARQALRRALDALEGPRGPIRSPGAHEGAGGADEARAGMAWFNSLTAADRRHWLEVAGSAVPAAAWRAFLAATEAQP